MKRNVIALIVCGMFFVGFSAFAGPLPDTGQTKCYDNDGEITCPEPGEAFYGQDGNYLINPPSYTKLDAAGNDLPDSATSWVMVRDNVTGLIWEVKTDDDSVHDKDIVYPWQDAQDVFVAQVNAETFGGHSDWRLPTIQELSSISALGRYDPAVNEEYFPNTMSSNYWSSTTNAGSTNDAWYVYFSLGTGYWLLKSSSFYVRAVRGGQSGLLDHLVINGDGTVTDTATGLMWQQSTMEPRGWESALESCQGSTLGGYGDWRLPNRRELNSIVDYTVYDPAVNEEYFPNTMSSYYWSSTTHAIYTNDAWGVQFYYGGGYGSDYTSFSFYVRAVRSGQNWLLGHLIISAPSQGSMWKGGDIMPISWDTSGISGNVKISISSQGGKDGTFQTIIDSTPNNGSYDWTVNVAASVNCVLRVEPVSDATKGTSQGLFSIEASEVPSEPKLLLAISGLQLSLSWYNVANADGYNFSYAPAPYNGPDTITTIDMADKTSFSVELWDGAAFFVAVQAYNDVGVSAYSNIEYFEIDYLPPIRVTPSVLDLSQGETKTCEISGGTSPYNAASSDPRIASVSVNANLLYVTGISNGSTTIILRDNGGDFVVYVTVDTAPTPVDQLTATSYMGAVMFAWVPSSDYDIAYYKYMLDIHESGQSSTWSGSWESTGGTTVLRELTEVEKTVTYAGKTVEICIKVLAVNDSGSESTGKVSCGNPAELYVEPTDIRELIQ